MTVQLEGQTQDAARERPAVRTAQEDHLTGLRRLVERGA